jgi:hypothetical protein
MAGSPKQAARKVLQLISKAQGLNDLSEQDEAIRAVVLTLQPADHASFLAGMEGLLTAAASKALRIIAEQRRPDTHARGRVWGTLASALGCAGAVSSLTATLWERLAGQQQQPAGADEAAAKGEPLRCGAQRAHQLCSKLGVKPCTWPSPSPALPPSAAPRLPAGRGGGWHDSSRAAQSALDSCAECHAAGCLPDADVAGPEL